LDAVTYTLCKRAKLAQENAVAYLVNLNNFQFKRFWISITIDHFKIAHVTKKAYTKFTGYEIGNSKVCFRGGFSFASSLVK